MNFASILVICIVAGLLVAAIWAIVRSQQGKAEQCSGSCAECTFRCKRQK